jgi:hypothetical protein
MSLCDYYSAWLVGNLTIHFSIVVLERDERLDELQHEYYVQRFR